MNEVADRLQGVRQEMADAATRSGRKVEEAELVAVSKTHDADAVRAAMDAGQLVFGESKVQEARVKIPLLPSHLRWHFIGHLQKNKIRHALPLFQLTHSIDSLELAQQVDRIAQEDGLFPAVLLEVNVAGEGSKFGFTPEKLREVMADLLELKRLTVEGVMTILPLSEKAEDSRKYFAQLRQLRDDLETEFAIRLPQLSMGMTNDFVVAIEEGATLVRVGTAIFGERSRANKE